MSFSRGIKSRTKIRKMENEIEKERETEDANLIKEQVEILSCHDKISCSFY